MPPDLRVILYFICPIVKNFENVFMRHLTVSYVIIYHTTIILNALNKVANCIEFTVVEG